VYNVKDYGAVPGLTSGCDAAISAAMAQMNVDDPTNNQAKVLYFPGDAKDYYTLSTVFLTRQNIKVRGDGRDISKVTAMGTSCQHHVFVGGLSPHGPPNPTTGADQGALDPAHYVDLFGKLDTTVANLANRAWGLDLGTDTIVIFWSCAFDVPHPYADNSHPGNWRGFRKITINLCIDAQAGQIPTGPLCGLGDTFQGRVNPWRLYTTGGVVRFDFCTGNAPTTIRSVQFPLSGATGVVRITFQIDLTTATFSAWVVQAR
jgi:hypothetical protein